MNETEKLIIETATKLFIEKGYRSTSMRDIASSAGVNVAMMNYYFRTKENLFDIIYNTVFLSMSSVIFPAMLGEKTVLERVDSFITAYIDGVMSNPEIPAFLIHELFLNPHRVKDKIMDNDNFKNLWNKFCDDLSTEADSGVIRRVDNPLDFVTSVMSMLIFPFVAKSLFISVGDMDEEAYTNYIIQRKRSVYAMAEAYLRVI